MSYYQETHGLSHTKIYRVWKSMKSRCQTLSDINYARYGGRGITVCNEWQQFEPFYEWAIENGYSEGLTIDRIDNDKGYSPDNCRWVTYKQNNNNKRNNRLIEYNGETHTLSEWSERLGVKPWVLEKRLDLYGWSIDETLSVSKANRNSLVVEYNREVLSLREWSKRLNINYWTLRRRLYKCKWPVEKAFNTPVKQ